MGRTVSQKTLVGICQLYWYRLKVFYGRLWLSSRGLAEAIGRSSQQAIPFYILTFRNQDPSRGPGSPSSDFGGCV